MNIEFERTIDDVIDFNLFHMTYSPSIKKQILFMQVLIGALVTLLVFSVFYLIYHSTNALTFIISILAGILAFIRYPQIVRKSTISKIQEMLKEGSNKALLGHQVISLSSDGIFIKNSTTEAKIAWLAIEKVVQSDKNFYLYTSSVNALIIPKTCFHSEKENQDFLESINAYRQQK